MPRWILALTIVLPCTAAAGVMDDGPVAPAPRFEGKVTRADSRNALTGNEAAMTRGALPPDLIDGLVAAGLISAAAARGAKAGRRHGPGPRGGHGDEYGHGDHDHDGHGDGDGDHDPHGDGGRGDDGGR